MIEKKVSRLFFRSGSFRPNHPGLTVELQRLAPTEEAVPPPASLDVYPRAGPYALLGVWTSQALPTEKPEKKCLSFPQPLSFFLLNRLTAIQKRNPRGVRLFRLGISPRKGRRPVWPFPPTVLRYLLGSPPTAGYFFTSGRRPLLREISLPS